MIFNYDISMYTFENIARLKKKQDSWTNFSVISLANNIFPLFINFLS